VKNHLTPEDAERLLRLLATDIGVRVETAARPRSKLTLKLADFAERHLTDGEAAKFATARSNDDLPLENHWFRSERSQRERREVGGVRCGECGRCHVRDDEAWQLCFPEIAEVAVYCPGCSDREFGCPHSYP
jgi:hypothetical protein